MKRVMWVFFGVVLFFFGISHIDAKTVIEPVSSGGSVALNLSFEEGYVGGIDLTLKVNGSVSLSNVNWSSVIASNYTKHYSYDGATGTLRLIVTTGNQKNNLVDKKGNVCLGTLSFKGNGKTSYTMNATALTIVDATYQSIVKKDLETKSNQFVLDGNSSSGGNTNQSGNQNSSNGQVNTDASSNTGSSFNSNGSSSSKRGSNSGGSSSMNQEQNGMEVETDDKTSENSSSVKDDKNTSSIQKPNESKKENSTESSKEETKRFPFRTVGFCLVAFVLLVLVIKKIRH